MGFCKDCKRPAPNEAAYKRLTGYSATPCPDCGAKVCCHMDRCWPCHRKVIEGRAKHAAHPWSCLDCAGLPLLGPPITAEQVCHACLNGAFKPPCKEHG